MCGGPYTENPSRQRCFFGGTNDKAITANDSFPVRVAVGQYKDQECILYDVNGVPRLCQGVYLICYPNARQKEAKLLVEDYLFI